MNELRTSIRGRRARFERVVGCGPILGLALTTSFAACSGHTTSVAAGPGPDFAVGDASLPIGLAGISPFPPNFGTTAVASVPPPPISGGTLLTTRDGTRAIAADPERDAVYIVDLKGKAVSFAVPLNAHDEPGRLVEDGAGRIHVALRGGGALVTIDPAKGTVIARRNVCPAPRGVAWDSTTDLVWVACATGELVGLPSAGGAATRSFTVERDLRDVIVDNGVLSVTKFRSAEVLRLGSDGSVTRRDALPSPQDSSVSHVAWRAVAGPSGTLVTVHQAESVAPVQTQVQGGYGGGGGGFSCGGFAGGPPPGPPPLPPDIDASTLPIVPVALDDGGSAPSDDAQPDAISAIGDAGAGEPDAASDSGEAPIVATGPVTSIAPANDGGPSSSCLTTADSIAAASFLSPSPSPATACAPSSIVSSVLTAIGPDGSVIFNGSFPGVLPVDVAVSPDANLIVAVAPGNAFTTGLDSVFVFSSCGRAIGTASVFGGNGKEQPTAIAFQGNDTVIIQAREPAELDILSPGGTFSVSLSSESRKDTGDDVFHTQAGAMIACASCHPEGGDDGHVWILDGQLRRTPSLRGTIAGTAPYHWPGDEPNLDVLVNDVYTIRMDGAKLPDDEMNALTSWVQTVPKPPAPASSDTLAAQRGKALFERADVGCSSCHSGPSYTNNQTVDVGTGGAFQVPPLVGVGWRTPLMHDGCATTLADRFGKCATTAHGSTGQLGSSDISDLIAYLETL